LVTNDAKFIRGSIATASRYFEMIRDSSDMLYRVARQSDWCCAYTS
jgi:hypothetical protein